MKKFPALILLTTLTLTVLIALFFAHATNAGISVNQDLPSLNRNAAQWLNRFLEQFCIHRPDGLVIGFCPTNGNVNENANQNQNANQNANTNEPTDANENANTPTDNNQNANTNEPTNENTNTDTNTNTNAPTNDNSNSNTDQGQSSSGILISEVFATTPNNAEWVEIYNGSGLAVDFNGWMLGDSSVFDTIPATTPVPAGGFLIILATSSPTYLEPLPQGTVKIFLDTTITNSGLNNSGDTVVLKNDAGTIVDAMIYGSPSGPVFTPTVPTSPSGHSYFRTSPTTDTDTAADWDHHAPNPGVAP